MSYMISLQNKNGILMAAESRANVFDELGKPICFFDKTQKIFLLGNRLGVATTGSDFISNKFLSTTVNNYQMIYKKGHSMVDLINDFLRYLKTELGNFNNQLFIFSGLEKSNISRYIFQQGKLQRINNYLPIMSIETNVDLPENWISVSQKTLIRISKKIIQSYTRKNYSDNVPAWQRVGGPIDFLWLSKRKKFRWIKQKKAFYFDDIKSFKKWVLRKKYVKVLSPDDEFLRVIRELKNNGTT